MNGLSGVRCRASLTLPRPFPIIADEDSPQLKTGSWVRADLTRPLVLCSADAVVYAIDFGSYRFSFIRCESYGSLFRESEQLRRPFWLHHTACRMRIRPQQQVPDFMRYDRAKHYSRTQAVVSGDSENVLVVGM